MKRTHIVAGVILDKSQRHVFITKRPDHVHKGGFWEFPGGKVEAGESREQAIARELDEEIGIQVTVCNAYEHFEFDYTDKSLVFDFMLIEGFDGEPFGKEGQQGQWVAIDILDQFSFPEANVSIVKQIMQQFA